MPEGVTPYPRWTGTLATSSRIGAIVEDEIARALRSPWSLLAVALGVAWGLGAMTEIYQLRQTGATAHTFDPFLGMLSQLLWFSLAVGAAVGGPALLEDSRSGALEMYFSRAVTRFEYLTGKVVAVLALTTATIAVPAIAYWGFSFVLFDEHPEAWGYAIFGALGFALMWGLLVSGLALGLSCVSRASGAAALMLFGGFVTLAYLVHPPALLQRVATLTALTEDARFAILSPFAALDAQAEWLFNVAAVHAFPYWWGLAVWASLTVLGWGLLAWRHPRARGDARG